jgi:hypothetical protein
MFLFNVINDNNIVAFHNLQMVYQIIFHIRMGT